MSTKKKCAICFTGFIRNSHNTFIDTQMRIWKSTLLHYNILQPDYVSDHITVVQNIHNYLYKTLEKNVSFDVFMAIPESLENASKFKPDNKFSKFYTKRLELKPITIKDINKDNISKEQRINFNWAETNCYHKGSIFNNNFLGQISDYKQVIDMVIQKELETKTKYDFIIRMRPDLCFFKPFPISSLLNSQDNNIYIRNIRIAGGQDIFFFGKRNIMMKYMNRILYFNEIINYKKKNNIKNFCAEDFGNSFLKMNGIPEICDKNISCHPICPK
tara:strand:- start:2025 stop:2843 length:819 start_codon:yes stop_codon:yes gene_type:complete